MGWDVTVMTCGSISGFYCFLYSRTERVQMMDKLEGLISEQKLNLRPNLDVRIRMSDHLTNNK